MIAFRCLPSERVFCREKFDGDYYHYRYGRIHFRLKPAMWLKVDHEGIDVGDQVETIGYGLEREKFVAEVWGMHFLRRKGRILYRLRRGDRVFRDLYIADHLKVLSNKYRLKEPTYDHPVPVSRPKPTHRS